MKLYNVNKILSSNLSVILPWTSPHIHILFKSFTLNPPFISNSIIDWRNFLRHFFHCRHWPEKRQRKGKRDDSIYHKNTFKQMLIPQLFSFVKKCEKNEKIPQEISFHFAAFHSSLSFKRMRKNFFESKFPPRQKKISLQNFL